MEIPVYDLNGSVNAKINFESEVSNETFNSGLVHEITTMQLAGLRSGNASTKTRGEVSGGGKKPYRQKGTGRARQGSTRAPQWRGGAIIFGPRPRNYSYREPSKKVLSALREALLVRVSEGQLSIVPTIEPDTHKTKDFVSFLLRFKVEPGYRNILLVSETFSYEAILGARNVPGISMLSPQQVTPLDVVLSDTVLVTSDSTQWIEQFLKGSV